MRKERRVFLIKDYLANFKAKFADLRGFSKEVLFLGTALCLLYYIMSQAALIALPHTKNPMGMLAFYATCIESAPAALLVGVMGGMIVDFAYLDRE